MSRFLLVGAASAALVALTPALAAGLGQGHWGGATMSRSDVAAKVARHFAKVDANQDGVLSSDEAKAFHEQKKARMQARMHNPGEAGGAAQWMQRMDSNKDGQLTKAEVDAAMAARAAERGRPARSSDHLFARVDTNKDGIITQAELAAVHRPGGDHAMMMGDMHGMHGGMHGMHMGMFERADLDKDGKVTLAEAQQAALQHFDEADANKDGKVTPEERKAMRDKHKAMHQG